MTPKAISSSMAPGIRACGIADLRPGDNKWSSSIIARDADTGEARWIYQATAHDSWDYDEIMENVLVDMDYGGRRRKLIVHPGRTGFVSSSIAKTASCCRRKNSSRRTGRAATT